MAATKNSPRTTSVMDVSNGATSIEELDDLVRQVREAQRIFSPFPQEKVDAIIFSPHPS